MRVILLTSDLIPAARRLVNRVFPRQTLAERLSLWAYRHKQSPLVRLGFILFGINDIIALWGVIDDISTEIIAITGLYSYRKDSHEAVWLFWFCVAPEERGAQIGSRLLDFSIERARETRRKYVRLYTSDDRNEAAAQQLYERKGFREVGSKRGLSSTTLYREIVLTQAND